ncbi:MAG: hypothetical protein WC756_11990 [Taibaiella sp.]|jgi:hypothetical protein
MRIPEKILDQWKSLYTRGDLTKMAKNDETQRKYIGAALSGGECTDEIFIIIRDFYNARIKLLNTALPNDKRKNIIKSDAAAAGSDVLQ